MSGASAMGRCGSSVECGVPFDAAKVDVSIGGAGAWGSTPTRSRVDVDSEDGVFESVSTGGLFSAWTGLGVTTGTWTCDSERIGSRSLASIGAVAGPTVWLVVRPTTRMGSSDVSDAVVAFVASVAFFRVPSPRDAAWVTAFSIAIPAAGVFSRVSLFGSAATGVWKECGPALSSNRAAFWVATSNADVGRTGTSEPPTCDSG